MTLRSSESEEIQTAIDKLTKLKAESTEGPWTAWKQIGAHGRRYGVEAGTLDDVLISRNMADAVLIETLRVTIDAQLAILADALKLQQIADRSSYAKVVRLVLPGLILARAINGGA